MSYIFLSPAFAQHPLTWSQLAEVTYSHTYDSTTNTWQYAPHFPPTLQSLDGKKVSITGYLIPLEIDGDGNTYALSALPYAGCYFCGGGGKESVLELRLKKYRQTFQLDEHRTFTGTLYLNPDPWELTFYLERAEVGKL
ncbi:MAG: DUF3299 domain-containing protein [Bacteroidota bacterium]